MAVADNCLEIKMFLEVNVKLSIGNYGGFYYKSIE